jgi:hypothetical protein
MNRVVRGLLAAACWVVCGCAEEPLLDLLEAQQSLAAARDAEADIYAPEEYEMAVMNLENAIASMNLQQEEPLWARSYQLASDMLALSIEQSEAAVAVSDSIRLDAAFQAELLVPEVQEAIDQAFVHLEQARTTNVVSRGQIEALDSDLQYAAQLLREARASQQSTDYPNAVLLSQQAIELADSVRSRSEEINLYALEVQLELELQELPAVPVEDPFAP